MNRNEKEYPAKSVKNYIILAFWGHGYRNYHDRCTTQILFAYSLDYHGGNLKNFLDSIYLGPSIHLVPKKGNILKVFL